MKTKFNIKREISKEYIELCAECEIPVKEAIKCKITTQILKEWCTFNNDEQIRSMNADCE